MDYEQESGFDPRDAAVPAGALAESMDRASFQHALKTLIAERRRRSSYFAKKLFADPAWDILLVLALAGSRYQRLTVSSLCERLDVPATTALRWIGTLTEEGLLIRRDDVNDKRRKFIELSQDGYVKMAAYCATNLPQLALAA